ncbi:MAG: type IV-A pilus assembly ATPase PilB [Legionellaceae bacterium]|nr:type IV-A pilus assembly ATPase PilB [Legionellaceae bacterium]
MMSNIAPIQGISNILVHENLLEQQQAAVYQADALAHKISLPYYLFKHNILTADKIASALAKNLNIPFFDLHKMDIERIPALALNEQWLHDHRIIPLFQEDHMLYVATDDPLQQSAFKDIQCATGLQVTPLVVESDKLQQRFEKSVPADQSQILKHYSINITETYNVELSNTESQLSEVTTDTMETEDSPIVGFLHKILIDAIHKKVSDIHFELYESRYRIRYRLDGILREVATPPLAFAHRITSRIKILAHLDISERRIPQDGRFKLALSPAHTIEFRVSTCPTGHGEKVVLRILDPNTAHLDIDNLGFSVQQKDIFLSAIQQPQGMILVTGPTGSGKTMTLYAALNLLNRVECNISTVEDPIEILMSGINQVNIHPKAGLRFSTVLRALLRQDPDVIMLGEIRDLETAEIAIKAAQTGHLVLSTLHTNSTAETLARLINIGVPAFNLANAIHLIIAQRLVRKLCPYCKKISEETFLQDSLENSTVHYSAQGCDRCHQGYLGRIAIFELLVMNDPLARLIIQGSNALDIALQAQADGMISMRQSGITLVKAGLTSLEEIRRVIGAL